MKSKISIFIKDFVSSRVGLLLAAINFTLLFYCYYERDWKSEPFHYFYESTLLKVLLFLNAPPFLFVTVLFSELGLTGENGEKILIFKIFYFSSLFLAATFQWLLIGYIIEKTHRSLKEY